MQISPETQKVTVHIQKFDGERLSLELSTEQSLMTALRNLKLIQGVCGGDAACGTCRLTVDQAWAGRLPPMERAEKRLLAALAEDSTDRLACQIKLEARIDGLSVRLPELLF